MSILSACVIIRNEEENLPSLLNNLISFVDEIIIVDTGSTDRSIAIAEAEAMVKCFHFPWCDDFSKARNHSLEHASGEWILVLDADERIQAPELFRAQLNNPAVDAYYLCCRNLQPDNSLTRYDDTQLLRLFRNNRQYRFSGSIHEQISPSIQMHKGAVAFSDSIIIHDGYQSDTVQGTESRRARNLNLLNAAIIENPNDYYYIYHLAVTTKVTDISRSYELFQKSLDIGGKQIPDHILEQITIKMAQISLERNQFAQAISEAQQCLHHNAKNLIAHVCLITAFITVQGYALALPHLDYVIQNALDRVPNPQDFLQLYKICSQQG